MKKVVFVLITSFTLCFPCIVKADAPIVDSAKIKAAQIKEGAGKDSLGKVKQDSIKVTKNDATVNVTTQSKQIPQPPTDLSGRRDIVRVIGIILILAIIIIFWRAAKKTDMLRASVLDPDGFLRTAQKFDKYKDITDIKFIGRIPKPYSLARSQLGIWTIVIGCSYLYLELCQWYPFAEIKIDDTLLALMGISAATTAAGNIIDNSASTEQQGVLKPSEGFFTDIMSDQNGINIHRFQNVIWTIIAVALYLSQVPNVKEGNLPILDSTLVALTGISSATYLGLKINENKPPALEPTGTTPLSNVLPEKDTPPASGTSTKDPTK